MVNYRGVIF